MYRSLCPEPRHNPCKEQFSCINCQLSWNTWEIFCAESRAQTLISADLTQKVMATGAHLYSPSFMSHLEIASSQCLGISGFSGWLLTPPWGHSAGPSSKKITVQPWGTLEKKVEMEIMTLVGNTRKALISNSANQWCNSFYLWDRLVNNCLKEAAWKLWHILKQLRLNESTQRGVRTWKAFCKTNSFLRIQTKLQVVL